MLVSIIGWIIFGIIAGAIARLLVPGRQPMGILMTMFLGIVGSLAGGLITWAVMGSPERGFEPSGWIMSIIGAIVVLWIYIYFSRQQPTRA
jgi:uncharacterized membrane protein YeaQ/YmgE (transglycosylase-associated protein family)